MSESKKIEKNMSYKQNLKSSDIIKIKLGEYLDRL